MNNETNFKTVVETLIEIELAAWTNGDKKFNVSNQFDESILESALEAVNNEKVVAECYKIYNGLNVPTMDIAHFLSTFNAPEISGAWIN